MGKAQYLLGKCIKIELCISIDGLMDSSTLIFSKVIRTGEYKKLIFSFFNLNICCGYSKEPFQYDSSFEHPNIC